MRSRKEEAKDPASPAGHPDPQAPPDPLPALDPTVNASGDTLGMIEHDEVDNNGVGGMHPV